MRINPVSFKSNYNKYITQQALTDTPSEQINEGSSKKLKLALGALAVIGSAAVVYHIVNKHNPKSIKAVKDSLSDIKNLMQNKPCLDPITKKLEGRRDVNAVKIYRGCIAEGKLKSLKDKLLNGSFDGKSAEIFEKIRANERILQQQAGFAV